jgi:type II secretory ATPase GspE/PulE/Tfp pilus assembly ATPase PilB-like protein
MLRQDPDIIMVGEIRDLETADIASRAALTGHLVLSTLHTQHALGTLTRLIDMGVPPWMVTACLSGVLAQRLVRRVCDRCADDYTPPAGLRHALASQFGSLEGAHFRKGFGCAACHRTGTRGRMGVYELLVIDSQFRRALAEAGSPGRIEMRDYALKRGFISMEEDAFRKACLGLIAPEEIVCLGFDLSRLVEEYEEEPVEAPAEEASAPVT